MGQTLDPRAHSKRSARSKSKGPLSSAGATKRPSAYNLTSKRSSSELEKMSRGEFNATRRQTLMKPHNSSSGKHIHMHIHGQAEHIRECRGYNEIPKVFIEQSHKMKNTKKILHKILVEEHQKKEEQQNSQSQGKQRSWQGEKQAGHAASNTNMFFSESQRGEENPDEQPQPLHLLKKLFGTSASKLLQRISSKKGDSEHLDSKQPPEGRPSALNNINQLHLKMIES